MKDVIVITRPLTMQVHLGNPKMARIPELTVRMMPECEGGGWYMPSDQAEAIVSAWNGFLDNSPEPKAPLPTWAQLVAYWKSRAEKPVEITDAMQDAGFAAIEEYEQWKAEGRFPRPTLTAHVFAKMSEAA